MMQYAAKDLFQTQSELMDAKVKAEVSDNIALAIDRIDSLKGEIRDLRQEMNKRFTHVETRLTVVETKLEMNELQDEFRYQAIDYGLKAGWLILATFISVMLLVFHVHPQCY